MQHTTTTSEPQDRINGYQIFVLSMLALINMQDGFDILAISFAANAITEDWSITRSELGVVFSAGLFGMMLGAMLLSPFADKLGRKVVAIIGLFLSGCGMLIAMQAPSINTLLIGRVLTGFGVGGILASLNTLVSEYAGEKYRSIAVAMFQLGFPMGAFLSGFLAAWLLDIGSWRSVFAFGAFTSFVFIPVMLLLPESTAFIAKSNKPGALEKINAIQSKFGRAHWSQLPKPEKTKPGGHFSEVVTLFTPEYRLRTVLIWLSFFSLLTLLYFMLTWTPKILVDLGFSEAQGNQGGRLINLVGMIGIPLMGILSLRFKPALITCAYMGLLVPSLLALAWAPSYFSLLLVLIGIVGGLMHGSMVGLYSTVPTLYSATNRATGTGWAIGLSRFGAVLGPVLAGLLLDAGWTPQSLFQAFSIMALATSTLAFLIYRQQSKLAHAV